MEVSIADFINCKPKPHNENDAYISVNYEEP
jgi:hypothetical protein